MSASPGFRPQFSCPGLIFLVLWLTLGAGAATWQAVILNLTLLDKDACLLGFEMHVCEVQLLLEPLVDLQVAPFPFLYSPSDCPSIRTYSH